MRTRLSSRTLLLVAVILPASLIALHAGRAALSAPQTACISRAAAPVVERWAAAAVRARAIACTKLAPEIPGFAIAVAVDGRIVWSEAFGYSNLEAQTPATPATQFRIGSVSKSLTADAVALLWEQGKLDLDAPVQRYVPTFPDKGAPPITTRLLGGHLAGVRHYQGDEFTLNLRYATVKEGLTVFQNDSLLFPPGTKFSYSSYGFNLISAVVEGASGEEFLAYMSSRVFRPLGMTSTAPDRNDSVIPNRTRFYERRSRLLGGGVAVAPTVDNSYKWAGGGFLSTAEDLARFGSAHLAPGHLKAATLELLFTPQHTTAGQATPYGIGWFVGRDSLGHRYVYHGGGSVGGTTAFGVDRDSRVVFALVTNLSDARLAPGQEIRAVFDSAASRW
ncbi:MAG TPA: serine hydrolase domain-containing protein [Gemmatimonadales bacterium]|nr:serine hydrolase domain-containing protein [Gemmatimonadales bacterium]